MMNESKRRGRPATGRNTKVVRVPLDFNVEFALHMQYDVLPVLQAYAKELEQVADSPRYYHLAKLMDAIALPKEPNDP